jgi:hypothetical protein
MFGHYTVLRCVRQAEQILFFMPRGQSGQKPSLNAA